MISIPSLLSDLHQKYSSCTEGEPASYIPELAKANGQRFAIVVVTVDDKVYKVWGTRFYRTF